MEDEKGDGNEEYDHELQEEDVAEGEAEVKYG